MKTLLEFDYLRPLCLAGFVGGLLWLQSCRPLRCQRFAVLRRLIRNFIFSAAGLALVRLSVVPAPIALAWWAEQHGFGILHWLRLPAAGAAIAGFLLMDWAYYWWHVATHRVPFLWRFHNVHHTDLDLDVTTAVRFHFGEILLSVPFRVGLVTLLGVTPATLITYEVVFECAVFFHHSNSRLPLRLERWLNHVVVTPRMHGIHHSIVRRETDSNWGTIFSWWDRLHRSLRVDVRQAELVIGVPAWREERELTIGKLFLMPFRSQRDWQLADEKIPEREPQPARELAP